MPYSIIDQCIFRVLQKGQTVRKMSTPFFSLVRYIHIYFLGVICIYIKSCIYTYMLSADVVVHLKFAMVIYKNTVLGKQLIPHQSLYLHYRLWLVSSHSPPARALLLHHITVQVTDKTLPGSYQAMIVPQVSNIQRRARLQHLVCIYAFCPGKNACKVYINSSGKQICANVRGESPK